jgi:hypothetical protein
MTGTVQSTIYGNLYKTGLEDAATVIESQRVMRWRLLLEEYGPDIRHIKGVDNVVEDAISRLPMANDDEPSTNKVQSLQLSFERYFNDVRYDNADVSPSKLPFGNLYFTFNNYNYQ